jgi:hypothetical protein
MEKGHGSAGDVAPTQNLGAGAASKQEYGSYTLDTGNAEVMYGHVR